MLLYCEAAQCTLTNSTQGAVVDNWRAGVCLLCKVSGGIEKLSPGKSTGAQIALECSVAA